MSLHCFIPWSVIDVSVLYNVLLQNTFVILYSVEYKQ